jgi:hypothetical protein
VGSLVVVDRDGGRPGGVASGAQVGVAIKVHISE